jgi:hypothetical protein
MKTGRDLRRRCLTQKVDADESIVEPTSGLAAGEIDAVVREVGPGAAPRQVVVVSDVGRGVAEHSRHLC